MQLAPVATLLFGAALLLVSSHLAQRKGLSEATSLTLSLCVLTLGLSLTPSAWQMWLAGDEAGERALSLARELGVMGLVFLAGTRFDLREVWKARRTSLSVAATGALLLILMVILLASLGGHNRGAVITTAAAIAGASLWLPTQLSLNGKGKAMAELAAQGAAATLTTLSILVLHFAALFDEAAGRLLPSSAYFIVALYELVKGVVFFSLAYFVASRFLARAEGRISPARVLLGYLLLVALIWVLAGRSLGQLGGMAWAFVAGALLVRSEPGKKLAEAKHTIATAVLLSCAFLPLLQSHGRSLTDRTLVFSAIIAALTYKFAIVWVGARMAASSGAEAHRVAVATLSSGEMGSLFLGFGLTQWMIDAQFYFGILAYALISMLLSSVLWRLLISFEDELKLDGQAQQSGAQRHKQLRSPRRVITLVALLGASLLAFSSGAQAQTSGDDPVTRAMERIQAAVGERAAVADRVLAAKQLVNESAEAKKQGQHDRAREALEKAEQIVAETGPAHGLTDELLRQVIEERAILDPKPAASTLQPLPVGRLAGTLPRPVLARYREYSEALARILNEEKVPAGLLAVALVESGFNPLALSQKGARGIWQLMPATARRYGLAVQPMNDHRTHPEHSTRAAAAYLRDLYQQFGDWKLALAAYNAGEARVQQIIDRTGIRDFDEMARRGLLPLETRNYVPAVMAAWAQLSRESEVAK